VAEIDALPLADHMQLFHAMGQELSQTTGGSSGALPAIFFAAAADAARAGADETTAMRRANAGRASYVGAARLEGHVDPSAEAVAHLFAEIAGSSVAA
jgi:dihydroxyacetone kinase